MCSECRKQYCHDLCPNAHSEERKVCCDCGECVEGMEAFLSKDGNAYCLDCISGMDTDELLRICGFGSPYELISYLIGSTDEVKFGKFIN